MASEHIYQKSLPSQKYILRNLRREYKEGHGVKVLFPGMYAHFKGAIPEFDVEPEADKILLWEIQTGFTRDADRDKRRKEIIKNIVSIIEHHPDYLAGIIRKKRTQDDLIEEVGVFVCEHCKEIKKTASLLIEHKKTHESKSVVVEGVSHVS